MNRRQNAGNSGHSCPSSLTCEVEKIKMCPVSRDTLFLDAEKAPFYNGKKVKEVPL